MDNQFKLFFYKYPYIPFNNLIDYYSIFGGLEDISLNLFDKIEESIKSIIKHNDIEEKIPFFIDNELFRDFLIALAKSDGKVFSLFNRLNIGNNLGLDITKELIEADLIELVDSREMPLKQYKKQLIKKELKDYTIEPKLYFKKPFFRFWYLCIEPYRDKKFKINAKLVIKKYLSDGYRLSSLVFEQLSLELLKKEFLKDGISIAGSSYWDRYSEFDIYAKSSSGIYILGECKYKGRAVTKLELTRLQEKANISNLIVDQYALFSKSGFTNELKKDSSVLLYDLESFKKLI